MNLVLVLIGETCILTCFCKKRCVDLELYILCYCKSDLNKHISLKMVSLLLLFNLYYWNYPTVSQECGSEDCKHKLKYFLQYTIFMYRLTKNIVKLRTALWRRITRLPHKRLQIHLCVEMQRINGLTPGRLLLCGTIVPFCRNKRLSYRSWRKINYIVLLGSLLLCQNVCLGNI